MGFKRVCPNGAAATGRDEWTLKFVWAGKHMTDKQRHRENLENFKYISFPVSTHNCIYYPERKATDSGDFSYYF